MTDDRPAVMCNGIKIGELTAIAPAPGAHSISPALHPDEEGGVPEEESFVAGIKRKGEITFSVSFQEPALLPPEQPDTWTIRDRHPLWPRAWRFRAVISRMEMVKLQPGDVVQCDATVKPQTEMERVWVWPDVKGYLRELLRGFLEE